MSWIHLVFYEMNQIIVWFSSFRDPNQGGQDQGWHEDQEKSHFRFSKKKIEERQSNKDNQKLWELKTQDLHLFIQTLIDRFYF